MPYQAEISRKNPTCFLFLIDQSGSMQSILNPTDIVPLDKPITTDEIVYTHTAKGKSASEELSDLINDILYNLAIKCAKEEGIRDYFHVGVIGYNNRVAPAFIGELSGKEVVPISEISEKTADLQERQTDDGEIYKSPIWFMPVAEGDETRMGEALKMAYSIVKKWLNDYPDCFPPIIINLTDGRPTDGDPTIPAQSLRDLSSSDGNVLLFNCHITAKSGISDNQVSEDNSIKFPDTDENLPDDLARRLFNMSSKFPTEMRNYAQGRRYSLTENSRGFVYNASLETVIDFLDIGTQVEHFLAR